MRKVLGGMAAAAIVGAALMPAVGDAARGTLRATLSGGAEVPRAGDPNGRGTAVLVMHRRKVCYTITLRGIAGSTQAHIHKAVRGRAGNVVVPLFTSRSSASRRTGCARTTQPVVARILARPADYYVNVHNSAYPNGAVRGQIRR